MPSLSLRVRHALPTLALFLGLTLATSGQAEELKVSHYLPPSHGFQQDFLEPWLEEIEAASGGELSFRLYDGTSSFGKVDRQADQVRVGVVDIALGLRGLPRGRFPHSSVMELPFMVKDAGAGSRALWQLYEEGRLGDDYQGYKVLALFVHDGGLFHTRETPIRSLDDLKGLRIRTPSEAISDMLSFVGASPVGLPPAAIYENLEKGVIDGLVATWDLVYTVRGNEVVRHHTDADAYTSAFYVLMSQRRFDSLSPDAQAAIDGLSGEALVRRFDAWWEKWEAVGREDARQRGQEVITIDDATRAEWRQQLQPMIDAYLDKLADEGVDDPRALYRRAQELIAEYADDDA